MRVTGSVALVTGANRGIGAAFLSELAKRGAKKIYAAVRDPSSMKMRAPDECVTADITDGRSVEALARRCTDVTLLINNAGVNFNTPLVGHPALENARAEMETNYFGTLRVIRAFAPILKQNGGGAIVNMLSITGRVNIPLMGSLSASKAACISMTAGVRAELARQGTQVLGAMPGAVDTRMTAGFPGPKSAPAEIAYEILDALEADLDEVYPGAMAKQVMDAFTRDRRAIEREFASILPA